MTDLVVISLEKWDGVWRRNQYLIDGLLKTDAGLRVLFVEPAADPLYDLISRRAARRGGGLRVVEQPGSGAGRIWAYQPTKLLPRRIDPGVDGRMASRIQRVADSVGFRNPILWINDPAGAATLETTGWPALYDVTDDWLEADRTEAEHERLIRAEALLMERCAEVVVCSPALVRTKGASRRVTLIPNAVDVEAYRVPRERPGDLPDGPVAVYLGTVHTDRIDVGLCVETAKAVRGRGRLVMVGPALLGPEDRGRLETAGVTLLGAKDRADVPAYLQHADVLLVPHVVTSFTDSLDPIKLYEYRAVGRPVVSTPVAGFREGGDPRITVATGSGFATAVAHSLPARSRFPAGLEDDVATWRIRVVEMRRVLERVSAAGRDPASPESL